MKWVIFLAIFTAFLVDPSVTQAHGTLATDPTLAVPQELHKAVVQVVDCPAQQVTVFRDRAQVTRLISLPNLRAGTTEVSVVGLSSKVDRDSVRVRGGKGEATILEVSYNTRWQPAKNDHTEHSALLQEKEDLEDQLARLEENLQRIAKESAWAENWARSLTESGSKSNIDPQQAMSFMQFYQKSLVEFDNRRVAIYTERKVLQERLDHVTKALSLLSTGSNTGDEVHEVNILLNTASAGPLELELLYVVTDASWHAAYDLRAESNDSGLDLTYYGVIINHSLDDWRDVPISLSTAQPAIGSAPPHLPTKQVDVYKTHHSSENRAESMFDMAMAPQMAFHSKASFEAEGGVRAMTTNVKESSICTSFDIPRRSTILSDNKPHKVTIGIIKLEAKYSYEIVPQLSTHAYLKASVVNNDPGKHVLLAGNMNVFLDGNFVSRSFINDVSPTESFELFLGTDSAIKVTYPPAQIFKDTQGFVSKFNVKTVKHLITIKNTKATSIRVNVLDQLPKSNNGKVQVLLLKPTLSEGDDDARTLTPANNLQWKLDIKAGQQIQLPFEYQLEWPLDQEINLS